MDLKAMDLIAVVRIFFINIYTLDNLLKPGQNVEFNHTDISLVMPLEHLSQTWYTESMGVKHLPDHLIFLLDLHTTNDSSQGPKVTNYLKTFSFRAGNSLQTFP